MFGIRKMKCRIDELEQIVSLLDYELRFIKYERERDKGLKPPPLMPNPLILLFGHNYFQETGQEMSLYNLRKKFWGSQPNKY